MSYTVEHHTRGSPEAPLACTAAVALARDELATLMLTPPSGEQALSQLLATPPASTRGSVGISFKRHAGSRVLRAGRFVDRSKAVRAETTTNSAIASFLTSGLLRQLHQAVHIDQLNPREAETKTGVFLCIQLEGLHALPALPLEDGSYETQLRKLLGLITTSVHGDGGELLYCTGDAALCLWPGAAKTFDGARLPSAGQTAGAVALSSTVSSLLFPLVVLASTRLAPAVGEWVGRRVGDDDA